jgi:peptide/nickel transport system substrate-binding protein
MVDHAEPERPERFDERRLTREDVLRGALTGAAALSSANLLTNFGVDIAQGATPKPKRGGHLRVGIVGNGSGETLDPLTRSLGEVDVARTRAIFEKLTDFDKTGKIVNQIAQEFSSNNDATLWKVKIRKDVFFHDGAQLTADDVVYSLRFILDPANRARQRSALAHLNPAKIRRLDQFTVELGLDAPYATVPVPFSSNGTSIIKDGTRKEQLESPPIGTGPFKFQSWTRGERSLFVRNDNHRIHNGPYVDQLEIISITDNTARVNALMGGQIDVLGALPFEFARSLAKNKKFVVLNVRGATVIPFTMYVDTPPFDDGRVRHAFRYMVDRNQLVKNALLGFGHIGNDLFAPIDPLYAHEIPQIPYDPERAKALLKAAGQSKLSVTLTTAELAPGFVEAATLLVEQAKKVGVTIKLEVAPTAEFFNSYWLNPSKPFNSSQWGYRTLENQVATCLRSFSPSNETHWKRKAFDQFVDDARQEVNPRKRRDYWVRAQRYLWNQGGYIIWAFPNNVDAYAARVQGMNGSPVRALGLYNFKDAYFA